MTIEVCCVQESLQGLLSPRVTIGVCCVQESLQGLQSPAVTARDCCVQESLLFPPVPIPSCPCPLLSPFPPVPIPSCPCPGPLLYPRILSPPVPVIHQLVDQHVSWGGKVRTSLMQHHQFPCRYYSPLPGGGGV